MPFVRWLKQHHPIPILAIVCTIIGLVLGGLASFIAQISVNSKNMLQSLIQAEATVLGFFGLIVTYVLVSYDTRLDRFEQERFDCELENKPKQLSPAARK
jgi:tetrahydromethanopterin S-methyltransferase subunit D